MGKIIWVDFSKKGQEQVFESARERLKEHYKERLRQRLRERMKREERAKKIIPFPEND